MDNPRWAEVDAFFTGTIAVPDDILDGVLRRSDAAGLPAISVSAPQGRLLQVLVAALGARTVLEIGTLGGYSTTWMARALPPDGRLVTLEAEPRHAAVARETFRLAGIDARVDLRLGSALDLLPALAGEAIRFDLAFIDADKPNTPEYFDWAVRLCRPGGLIVVDNAVRDGAIADPQSSEAGARAMRRLVDQIAGDTRVTATGLQTVGSKGYDGFIIATVRRPPGA